MPFAIRLWRPRRSPVACPPAWRRCSRSGPTSGAWKAGSSSTFATGPSHRVEIFLPEELKLDQRLGPRRFPVDRLAGRRKNRDGRPSSRDRWSRRQSPAVDDPHGRRSAGRSAPDRDPRHARQPRTGGKSRRFRESRFAAPSGRASEIAVQADPACTTSRPAGLADCEVVLARSAPRLAQAPAGDRPPPWPSRAVARRPIADTLELVAAESPTSPATR